MAAAGIAAAAVTVALASAPAAASIAPGRIQLINSSEFSALFDYPQAGNFTTTLVAPHTNKTFDLPSGVDQVCPEGVDANGNSFRIISDTTGHACLNEGVPDGVKLQVFGSAALPGWRQVANQ